MPNAACTCNRTPGRGGRHALGCPQLHDTKSTLPSADGSFADIAKFLAGNLVPPSDIISNAIEDEIHFMKTGNRPNGRPTMHSTGMVAKHMILTYRIIAEHSLLKTQGQSRQRLMQLLSLTRAAIADEAIKRHPWLSAAAIAEFGAEFTLQWFATALGNQGYAWDDMYMRPIVRAMENDSGAIGRVWRGQI